MVAVPEKGDSFLATKEKEKDSLPLKETLERWSDVVKNWRNYNFCVGLTDFYTRFGKTSFCLVCSKELNQEREPVYYGTFFYVRGRDVLTGKGNLCYECGRKLYLLGSFYFQNKRYYPPGKSWYPKASEEEHRQKVARVVSFKPKPFGRSGGMR